MSEDDPIIAEIRAAREALLAEHHDDLDALVKHLQRRTEEAARVGHKIYSPVQCETEPPTQKPTRKAG